MSNVTNNVIVNSFAEAQEAASLINFTVRRLEQRINDSICDAYELHDENTRLKQRIKRLEEAGDALANHHLLVVTTYDKAKTHVSDWNKAKESKP